MRVAVAQSQFDSCNEEQVFGFRLPPATKAPRGRPSPRRRAEENEKNQAETGGSG